MRLLEAIVEANHRAASGDETATLDASVFAESLPLVALTCIDPRLNRLLPDALGIPEDSFIWLRNAGNIIFDSMSSMTRTLALACVIKGGKEIAVIGHTDCRVGKFSMVELTDRFKALGIDRSRLPENLTEFFGLFASERQNVLRGVEFIRNSPLISPKVPVHGLLIDIQTGKLEWIVNGYQTLATAHTVPAETGGGLAQGVGMATLGDFQFGEMKFPEGKIGDTAQPLPEETPVPAPKPAEAAPAMGNPRRAMRSTGGSAAPTAKPNPLANLDVSALFSVLGADDKIYGPVTGRDVLKWVADGRIDTQTLVQKMGHEDWKPLAHFVDQHVPKIPIPPALSDFLKRQLDKGGKK